MVVFIAGAVCLVVALYVWGHRTALPERLVLQFNAVGQPTTLPASLSAIVFIGVILSVCVSSVVLDGVVGRSTSGVFAAASIAWLCAIGFGAISLVNVNLTGQPSGAAATAGAVAVAVAATLVAVLAASSGGQSLNPGTVVGELAHRSTVLAIFCAAALFGVVALGVAVCPDWLCRAITLLAAAAMLWAGSLAAVGFRYRVTTDGIEVLGVRRPVAFVPADAVAAVRVGELDRFVGYGIRGIQGGRVFVLEGRGGVWVETSSEKLFLAHADPERLLELIRRVVPAAVR